MKNKTWTATGIEQGALTMQIVGDDLHVTRTYTFTGAETVGNRKLRRAIEWKNVPANIKSALAAIDIWTHNEILKEEKME